MSFIPTLEQQAIERAFNRSGYPSIKVIARAGSGKTSTSRQLAQSTHRKGVYLAFGRKNAIEARQKFPAHMQVKTTHALAFAAMNVRERWGHKLKDEKNKWPMWKIIKTFRIEEQDGISAEHILSVAQNALRNFLYSADPTLTLAHVYDPAKNTLYFLDRLREHYDQQHPFSTDAQQARWEKTFGSKKAERLEKAYQQVVLSVACDLWNAQIDPKHPLPMEHDAYLKLWQLERPIISGIDYLILDECQDSNTCVTDIVLNQKCQIIFIGDPEQGIYGFRKARNVLDDLDAETFYLSKSFRFGQVIADVANAILWQIDPDLIPIVGNERIASTLGEVSGCYALVSRTNAGLFDEAVQLASRSIPFHVMGSLKEAISRTRSAYYLYEGQLDLVQHHDFKTYDDWEDLKKEAQYDVDLARYMRMVEEKEGEVLKLCETLEDAGEVKPNEAQVVLTTTHRSKGLEYPQVRLADDFSRLKFQDGVLIGPLEEKRVLYVAATRAEQRLELNSITNQAFYHQLSK